jgi:peroxiredoxin Q/BCP
MTTLATGTTIPSFSLESDAGARVDASSLRGAWAVLYFYPKADTPGCTREAQAFTAHLGAFRARGARVLGVSKDKPAALCKFRDKYALEVELLADPELTVHRAFGAFGEKVMYGKRVEGVIRSTFVIDPSGVVRHVFPSVKVDGHAEKVFEVLAGLQGGDAPKEAAAPKRPARA